ncbi:MAG: pantetheine-phosphate adenylyltransferase [Saprospiraceae bacterium]|nr:pantetheine-phosphate adenylyltransferase [Saprospiraceae bacterium]MBK9221540.1 pantetheine-phosphate adenylyltransferase [Saprospiraceae bacterium]
MPKIAVFPGSFDPITKGHMDIVLRAMPLFDLIYIAIGENSQKKSLFSLKQRKDWIQEIFQNEEKLIVTSYHGLTATYCKSINANYLIRGIRNASDFDYEKTISQINHTLVENLETVFFISRPELSHISSTIVRELILGKADVQAFVPALVKATL